MAQNVEQRFALPIFLTEKNKYPMGILFAVIATVLYMTTNHFHLFEPKLLPMWGIDLVVPFIPETVWIYTSEYYLFVFVYVLSKDLVNTNKYLYSFLGLQFVSVMIFTFWPTTFPRDLYPLPEDLDPFTQFLFTQLRLADSPASCAPSLHVSSCYLSSFIFLDEQRKKFPIFFLWATAVAITTLTTKQHYLLDVILGFLMAVIFYRIFHRYIPYRRTAANLNGNRSPQKI